MWVAYNPRNVIAHCYGYIRKNRYFQKNFSLEKLDLIYFTAILLRWPDLYEFSRAYAYFF